MQQGGGVAGPSGSMNPHGGGVGGFAPSQQSLQSPLAYLEKTTNNLGIFFLI